VRRGAKGDTPRTQLCAPSKCLCVSADPLTLTTIVAILIVIAVTACLAPSRRATRLEPSAALRYE